jgi:hypothetical protein
VSEDAAGMPRIVATLALSVWSDRLDLINKHKIFFMKKITRNEKIEIKTEEKTGGRRRYRREKMSVFLILR